MHKVSVIIPVYKVESFMERCARSLFEQTLTEDVEFIFVDDASPDHSVLVINQCLDDYPKRKNQTKILVHSKIRAYPLHEIRVYKQLVVSTFSIVTVMITWILVRWN